MPRNQKGESNLFVGLVVVIALLIAVAIYFLYFKEPADSEFTSKPQDEGFTYSKTKKKTTSSGSGTAAPMPSVETVDLSTIVMGKSIVPKNKLSHVAAVREMSSFTWDDSDYYKQYQKPLQPIKQSSYDEFFEKTVKPYVDASGFNQEMAGIVKQAENNPQYQQAINLYNAGKYRDAVEILANIVEKSPNLYLKSVALGYLVEIYEKTGDEVQRKKAFASMMMVEARLYVKAFPGTEKKMVADHPETKDAYRYVLSQTPSLKFGPPKKSF